MHNEQNKKPLNIYIGQLAIQNPQMEQTNNLQDDNSLKIVNTNNSKITNIEKHKSNKHLHSLSLGLFDTGLYRASIKSNSLRKMK